MKLDRVILYLNAEFFVLIAVMLLRAGNPTLICRLLDFLIWVQLFASIAVYFIVGFVGSRSTFIGIALIGFMIVLFILAHVVLLSLSPSSD